eukprot:XP_011443882.1 PREDICTED: uncharacterized protein LOC105339822 isoform X1 [Crassostrea gigas]
MTLNGITMGLIAEVLLHVTAVAIAGTVQSQNSNVERQNRSGNELVFYLMEQLYDMKPKIETMKTKIKDMEFYIAAQKKQIEALQNRKTMICESGVVEKYANPHPSWPYIESIKFKSHFEERPTVTYGLYFLDSDRSTNLRVITEITDVTKTGFRMKLTSYDDSKLYGAKINWMACGK